MNSERKGEVTPSWGGVVDGGGAQVPQHASSQVAAERSETASTGSHPLRLLSQQSPSDPDDTERIPSGDSPDRLLTGVRGRWRMPEAWSRAAFERIFQRTLEQVWSEIQAGHWKTYTSLATVYKQKPSWISCSLKYCMLREKVIESRDQFDSYFKRRKHSGISSGK